MRIQTFIELSILRPKCKYMLASCNTKPVFFEVYKINMTSNVTLLQYTR